MVLALTRLWKREILQKAGGTCLRNRFPEMFSLQGSILKRLVFYSPSQYSRYSQKFGLVLTLSSLWKYSLRKLTGLSGLLATQLAITWLPYPSLAEIEKPLLVGAWYSPSRASGSIPWGSWRGCRASRRTAGQCTPSISSGCLQHENHELSHFSIKKCWEVWYRI